MLWRFFLKQFDNNFFKPFFKTFPGTHLVICDILHLTSECDVTSNPDTEINLMLHFERSVVNLHHTTSLHSEVKEFVYGLSITMFIQNLAYKPIRAGGVTFPNSL